MSGKKRYTCSAVIFLLRSYFIPNTLLSRKLFTGNLFSFLNLEPITQSDLTLICIFVWMTMILDKWSTRIIHDCWNSCVRPACAWKFLLRPALKASDNNSFLLIEMVMPISLWTISTFFQLLWTVQIGVQAVQTCLTNTFWMKCWLYIQPVLLFFCVELDRMSIVGHA